VRSATVSSGAWFARSEPQTRTLLTLGWRSMARSLHSSDSSSSMFKLRAR
jgi:hypothetical protein